MGFWLGGSGVGRRRTPEDARRAGSSGYGCLSGVYRRCVGVCLCVLYMCDRQVCFRREETGATFWPAHLEVGALGLLVMSFALLAATRGSSDVYGGRDPVRPRALSAVAAAARDAVRRLAAATAA
eukprot:2730832-Pleurochrysis_carterae.AAC.1